MAVSGEVKRRPNKLGLGGWFYAGRYGPERYLYILHRLAGLGMLLYFLLHIFVTAVRVQGPSQWKGMMGILEHPIFRFGEFLVFLAFAYHALNGIRLIITELGFSLGKPHPPKYPYEISLSRQRILAWVLMIIAFVIMVAGFIDFYIMGG